ncbi:MAG TPA: DinB family protein [Puia sp.]|nr:DinB family protein [Puia sp.]
MDNLFETLWIYTDWANDTVLNTLESLGSNAPASSLRLMSHLVNAQKIWLNRLNDDPAVVGLWVVHPLQETRNLNTETLQGLKAAIGRFGRNPGQKVAYRNLSGVSYESPVSDVLLQVFNHGTYHRAQIAMDLRDRGLEPVNTDYITFTRIR